MTRPPVIPGNAPDATGIPWDRRAARESGPPVEDENTPEED